MLFPQSFSDLTFIPKRYFLVTDVPISQIRGEHAHYKTEQYLVCVQGEIDVILFNGTLETVHTITKGEAIFVPSLIWDSQRFVEEGSILLVLASTEYDKDDYILSKDYYRKLVR